MNVSTFDRELLRRTVAMEARSESPMAQSAVAHSIVNRHLADKWFSGATLAETILMPEQYSSWLVGLKCENRAQQKNLEYGCNADGNDPVYAAVCAIVDRVLDDPADYDPSNGATHYHDVSVFPAWTKDAERTATYGRLIFWKGVR